MGVAYSLGVWLHTFDSSAPLNGMMTACGSLASIHSLILDNLEEQREEKREEEREEEREEKRKEERIKLCDHATKSKHESRLLRLLANVA